MRSETVSDLLILLLGVGIVIGSLLITWAIVGSP